MTKNKLWALGLALVLIFMSGCGSDEPEETPEPTEQVTETPEPTQEPEPEAEPTETEETGFINPLTGEQTAEDISSLRPYAVMINNLEPALPQMGVSQADIIYEIPVEGGITRMLAVYQDIEGVGEIGTIRSARPYYLDVAQGHDAIYVHAGGSEQAYTEISTRPVDNIDGVMGTGQEFYRDEDRYREAGQEHSLMTSDALLLQYVDSYGYRLEHQSTYSAGLGFADDGTPAGGESAEKVTVEFSTHKTGIFEYDARTGLYMISQYGEEYIDGVTEEQVGVTNVLVLFASFTVLDGEGRLATDFSEGGAGYYICGGQCVPILWSKASATDPFVYTLEDGSPFDLGVGKSYVNIVSMTGEVTVE